MLLPLLATVCPKAEGVRLAVTAPLPFVTVRSEPSPSNSGVFSSSLIRRLPWEALGNALDRGDYLPPTITLILGMRAGALRLETGLRYIFFAPKSRRTWK